MPRPREDGAPAREPQHRKLTDAFVRRVQPEALPTAYHDTAQKGLALMVRPNGNRSYKFLYRMNGRPRWYHIGDAAGLGLADARKIARRLYGQVCLGTDPQAEKKAVRKAGTFRELHDRYLEEWAKRRNRSWKQADRLVKNYLISRWGALQAASISRSDVRTVFNAITNKGAPVVANQVLAAASAIFAWAIREEVVDMPANPCAGIPRNPTKARERVLADTEVPDVWRAFDDLDPVRGNALRMILLTGQRPGEIRHMRRQDIDGGWWSLPGQAEGGWPGTKNGETHRVWLTDAALEILEELDDDGRFVFASERGKPVAGLDETMRAVCAKLEIPKVTPHDLRRTHGTTITGLGFTREQMNRLQNHKEGGIGSV
ncbi:MAG: integrase family protein, partial [Alphaproteobacteria bacterium]|nr:integrase family protein [Alphaproteobacteria bacterium]